MQAALARNYWPWWHLRLLNKRQQAPSSCSGQKPRLFSLSHTPYPIISRSSGPDFQITLTHWPQLTTLTTPPTRTNHPHHLPSFSGPHAPTLAHTVNTGTLVCLIRYAQPITQCLTHGSHSKIVINEQMNEWPTSLRKWLRFRREEGLSILSFLSQDDLWYPKAVVNVLPYYEMSWVQSITAVSSTVACTHAHTHWDTGAGKELLLVRNVSRGPSLHYIHGGFYSHEWSHSSVQNGGLWTEEWQDLISTLEGSWWLFG